MTASNQLARSFVGTGLTIRGAIATVLLAPTVWALLDLVFVAMPS